MAPALLSIDFIRGIFRRYDGYSKFTRKPKMTHRRDMNDEDWQRWKDQGQLLTVDDVENYRVNPLEEDRITTAWPNSGEGPTAA